MDARKERIPKVLFVAPYSPWPPTTGGHLRSARFAEAAAKLGQVRVLALYSDHSLQGPAEIEEVVMRPDRHSPLWWLRNTDRPLAPQIEPMIMRRVNRNIREFAPDVIFFEQTVTTGVIEGLQAGSAKLVFNSQNFDTDLLREIVEESNGGFLTIEDKFRLDTALQQELWAASNSDLVICCSDMDADRFKNEVSTDCVTVSNPLPNEDVFDLEIYCERYLNPDVLYVGSMGYQPNAVAARTLMSIFSPILPTNGELILAGRSASLLEKSAQGKSNVRVVSDPVDLTPVLKAAGLTAMPIRQGGGTRLKVLEAMAAGLVLIATEKAVEGLGLVPGQHYVRAETDNDFRNAYQEWRNAPEQCVAMARRARSFIEESYSRAHFEKSVQKSILDLIGPDDGQKNSNPRNKRRPRPFNEKPVRDSQGKGVASKVEVTSGAKAGTREPIHVEPLLVGTFHKTGSTLLKQIFLDVGKKSGLAVCDLHSSQLPLPHFDVLLDNHCDFAARGFDPRRYPVLVVIRDPRDVVISSAHYHMKSREGWLHIPRDDFDGKTYQEQLNSLKDMRARYIFEMDNVAGQTVRNMVDRKTDPAYASALFVTLEELMTDMDLSTYKRAFSHLGFSEEDLPKLLDCALANSAFNGASNQHMRDPRPEQWREHFNDELHLHFTSRFRDAANVLGYEDP